MINGIKIDNNEMAIILSSLRFTERRVSIPEAIEINCLRKKIHRELDIRWLD